MLMSPNAIPYIDPKFFPVLRFIEGLTRSASKRKFEEIADQVRNKRVLENLGQWLPKHELGRRDGTRLVAEAIVRARR